ncbi:phycocyanin associated linker protein [Chondrocystis sp. NIES-4102]|nr:phycocyanin associated linker protein [Chondrocystis sp. NIES-4102]
MSKCDRAQGNSGNPRLTYDLARNTATPVNILGGRGSLSAITTTDRGSLYRVITQGAIRRTPQLRRSVKEYVVPYERLSATLQKINQQGGRVISLTVA